MEEAVNEGPGLRAVLRAAIAFGIEVGYRVAQAAGSTGDSTAAAVWHMPGSMRQPPMHVHVRFASVAPR